VKDQAVKALIPIAAFLLGLLCPAVPSAVWSALLTAAFSGLITLGHIKEFLAAHDIKIYSPKDIQTPDAKPVPNSNLTSGGYHDEGPKSM
jgi:hypothetical protein